MNSKLEKIWKLSIIYKLKQLFFYKKEKENKKILVVGGYGYNNVGDEAQLNKTIIDLKNKFPDHLLKILTPNPNYTHFYHDKCVVGEAPRVAFYDQGEHWLYGKANNIFVKFHFIFLGLWLYLNAFLVRAKLPTLFINARKASLLYDMFTSDIIYFEGGGYLTGKTASRLLDGAFFIAIGRVFKLPSYLSGQTIGVWNGKINELVAKWGFSKAKVITVRDPEASIEALKKIGIRGDHIFVTHDDALFCEKVEDTRILKSFLLDSGMKEEEFSQGYLTFHMHYWGLKTSQEKEKLMLQMEKIISEIRKNTNKKIVLLSMTPTDEFTINDFKDKFEKYNLMSMNFVYDFKLTRAIIGNSEVCVTMKHHPIIFAIGEKIPVISMALSDYYIHKNVGALKLFGLEKYNIDLSKKTYLENFKFLFKDIKNNRDEILNLSESYIEKVKVAKNNFLDLIE